MFAIVVPDLPPARGFFKRLSRLFLGVRPEHIEVWEQGACFAKLLCRCPSHKIPWKRILALSQQRGIDCFLLPQGVNPSVDLPIFISTTFAQVLFKNTVDWVLEATNGQIDSAVLCDRTGTHRDCVWKLVAHVGTVKVLTDRRDRYEDLDRAVMEQTGAALMIGDDVRMVNSCDLILAPDRLPQGVQPKRTALVLTRTPQQSNCMVISDYRVKLPPNLATLCPKGVDHTAFLAALYECAGYTLAGQAVADEGGASKGWVEMRRVIEHLVRQK